MLNNSEWKKNMVEEPDGAQPDAPPSQPLTDREMILRLIQLVSARERTTEELERMLAEVEKIIAGQQGKTSL